LLKRVFTLTTQITTLAISMNTTPPPTVGGALAEGLADSGLESFTGVVST
jgi:hypothetical protein